MDPDTRKRLKHQIASYEALVGSTQGPCLSKSKTSGCLVIPLASLLLLMHSIKLFLLVLLLMILVCCMVTFYKERMKGIAMLCGLLAISLAIYISCFLLRHTFALNRDRNHKHMDYLQYL